MLFYTNGREKVKLNGIEDVGIIGQMLIIGCELSKIQNALDREAKSLIVRIPSEKIEEHAPFLARHPYLSIFTIIAIIDENYILRDAEGNEDKCPKKEYSTGWLFDLAEWIKFNDDRHKAYGARSELIITTLKEVIVAQGVRVISEKTAKQLGELGIEIA